MDTTHNMGKIIPLIKKSITAIGWDVSYQDNQVVFDGILYSELKDEQYDITITRKKLILRGHNCYTDLFDLKDVVKLHFEIESYLRSKFSAFSFVEFMVVYFEENPKLGEIGFKP